MTSIHCEQCGKAFTPEKDYYKTCRPCFTKLFKNMKHTVKKAITDEVMKNPRKYLDKS